MSKESGWAYVIGTEASGPKGSIQIAGQNTNLEHDTRLQWSEDDQALIVSGNIIAKNFEIQNQSVTVFHLDVTGSSTFGDSQNDTHSFTGSVNISQDLFVAGEIYASQLNIGSVNVAGLAIDEYSNQLDNHLVLGNGAKSIRTETNLSYENSTLYVTGSIQTDELSSSLGYFDALEAEEVLTNILTADDTRTTFLTGSNLYVGDIVLTGRVIDINGNEILRSSTAGTLSSISNSGVSQTISSNSYSTIASSNALGMEFAIVEKGLSVDNNAFYVGENDLVGVGTNKPAKRLEVYDSSASQLRLSSIGAGQLINGGSLFTPTKKHTDLGTNTTGDFHILPTNGRVGINTTTPQHALDVNGDLGISGDLYVSGTLHARMTDFIVSADTVVLGDESTDIVTINASTMAVPNGLAIDDLFFIKDGTIGVGAISPQAKFMIESPVDQLSVGTQTNKLSLNVSNSSTKISADSGQIEITNQTNVLGELSVGPSGNAIITPGGQVSSSVSVSSDYGYFNNLETNTITNGNTIIGSDSIITPVVIADSIIGQLQTAQQPNITQVGVLTGLDVDGDVDIRDNLSVGSTLAIGTQSASRKVEIKDSSAQLRLTNTNEVFGISEYAYVDLGTNADGNFYILPTNGRVGINTTTPQHTLDIVGDLGISGDLYVSGTLHARMTDFIVSADTVTLGDESTDVVTINASTMAVPNGLTIDNQFFIKDGTIGVGAISPQAKFMIESPTDQFKVGTQTNKLSVNVSSASARLSVNSGYIDIANQTNVLGELRVGSNSNVIMNPIGTFSSSVSVSSDYGYFNNLETNTITNGNTIIGSNSVSTPSVISTSLTGQLQTAQQPKITQVGTLDFLNVSGDAGIVNDLNVGSSLAVGTQSASRKVEIKDSNAQLRLTNTNEVFGISEHTYADFNVNSNGDLSLQPSSGLVIAPSLKLTNIQQGSSTSFLSLDGNGNVILAPAVDPGIEVRNRTVVENSYSIQNSDYFIGIQAKSNLTITLPDASQLQNGQIMVLKDEDEMADVFSITINARPSQSIENKSSLTFVSPGSSIMIYTDGTSRFFIM